MSNWKLGLPDDYSVHVWVGNFCVMEKVVAHAGTVDSEKAAAKWAYREAVRAGLINEGDKCEVDVAPDASFEWTTHALKGSH